MRFGPTGAGRLSFTVDGVGYALDLPDDGSVLAGIAATGQWPEIVPGLLAPECRGVWVSQLRDPLGPISWRTTWRIATGLAEEIYGMPWWAAIRLCATAQSRWRDFAAWTVAHGFDPARAPAHRICAAVLAWLRTSCRDEKDLVRLEQRVFTPPPEMIRAGARPPGFSDADLAQQAAELAALAEHEDFEDG
jgi:hypothetical protein